jgi:hypothetical protein
MPGLFWFMLGKPGTSGYLSSNARTKPALKKRKTIKNVKNRKYLFFFIIMLFLFFNF